MIELIKQFLAYRRMVKSFPKSYKWVLGELKFFRSKKALKEYLNRSENTGSGTSTNHAILNFKLK